MLYINKAVNMCSRFLGRTHERTDEVVARGPCGVDLQRGNNISESPFKLLVVVLCSGTKKGF